MYAILEVMSEELDADNNPVINLQNLGRGAEHVGEGETSGSTLSKKLFKRLKIVFIEI
jgi:hypothetical protein